MWKNCFAVNVNLGWVMLPPSTTQALLEQPTRITMRSVPRRSECAQWGHFVAYDLALSANCVRYSPGGIPI